MSDGPRVLLMEDEALSAMWLQRELERLGCTVLGPVATGEEAVRIGSTDRPDVILADIRLAGAMDGIEAAQAIRSAFNCAVVFMTGYRDADYRRRAQELAPLAYLIKPVRMNDVEQAILPA